MWRRLFGGGDAKNPGRDTKPHAEDESIAKPARAAKTDADAGVEADDDEDLDEIPFDDDELPEFGDEAEAEAHVHAGLARDPENPDAAAPSGDPADTTAATPPPVPSVRIHDAGPFVKHVEEISPYQERPEMAREEYEMLVAELPMPRKKQMREFAEYVAGAKSWHEHLPLLPTGAAFRFYLNPFAGMDRIVLDDGRAAFIPRGEDADPFHYSWMPTGEYRQRFGFLSFACAEASRFIKPVRLDVDDLSFEGTLDNNVNYAVLWVPQKPFQLPEAILKAGACFVTGVVHPRAACPATWQRTLETVKSNHVWPPQTGGPETLARIRARVAATGAVAEIDPELEALVAPERQRLLDEMVAAMTRMVGQLHGSL